MIRPRTSANSSDLSVGEVLERVVESSRRQRGVVDRHEDPVGHVDAALGTKVKLLVECRRFVVGAFEVDRSPLPRLDRGLLPPAGEVNPESCGPIVVEELLLAALVQAIYDTIVTYVGVVGPTLVVFVVWYGLFLSSSTEGSLGTATCTNERSKHGPRTSRIELENSRTQSPASDPSWSKFASPRTDPDYPEPLYAEPVWITYESSLGRWTRVYDGRITRIRGWYRRRISGPVTFGISFHDRRDTSRYRGAC